MTRQQLLKKYESLPANTRREVDELVASLAREAAEESARAARKPGSIAREPFVGMWRDRTDMADGAEWVRSLRQRQWGRRIY
jgi:hypothetical protein